MTALPDAPLFQASYAFAKAFGWTPYQMRQLTMAQASAYLELLELEKHGIT